MRHASKDFDRFRPAVLAVVLRLVAVLPARATTILTLKLEILTTPEPCEDFEVRILAQATGTLDSGKTLGGIADTEFDLTSSTTTNVVEVKLATSGKADHDWDTAISSDCQTVDPSRTDDGSDGDLDATSAAFADFGDFGNTSWGWVGLTCSLLRRGLETPLPRSHSLSVVASRQQPVLR